MKRKYSLLTLFALITFFAKSQSVNPDVIATAGDFYANSSGQLQWTLGEVMTETYQNSSNMLTQGFHQPFNSTTGIANIYSSNLISVYPNPATEFVSINFNTLKGKYLVSLSDVTGKLLTSEEVDAGNFSLYQLSVKNYSNGMYFITISNPASHYNQSTRIIKAN